jgi:hypothetical protein
MMKPDEVDSGVSKLSKAVALILIGWFASSAYHQTLVKDQKAQVLERVQKVDLPKLKAQAAQVPLLKAKVGCEHWRAKVTEDVAKQAIVSANSDKVPTPDSSAIPADRCDSATGK